MYFAEIGGLFTKLEHPELELEKLKLLLKNHDPKYTLQLPSSTFASIAELKLPCHENEQAYLAARTQTFSSTGSRRRPLEEIFLPFLDDILIASCSFDKHLDILNRVFTIFWKAKLTINQKNISYKYVDYVVDQTGLHVDPDKLQAILDNPISTFSKEVGRFNSTASCYRRFIKDYSMVMAALTVLLKKNKI